MYYTSDKRQHRHIRPLLRGWVIYYTRSDGTNSNL